MGIQSFQVVSRLWIPAYAGMTDFLRLYQNSKSNIQHSVDPRLTAAGDRLAQFPALREDLVSYSPF